ncbi:MAG: dicarboxylate/amino acid:cation symporter [Duodenibacillus sp.]|nr:dicarboxylate/amino acid:cation symporter [Duodenibacillus sp.]
MSDQQSSTNTMRRPVMTPQQKRAQILLAACYLVAIVLGLVNGLWGSQFWQTAGQFISDIFIRLFRFIAIPIIAVSIISTLATISRSKESGKIFRHTIFYTLFTTVLAASLAAVLFVLYAPANVALTGTASQPEALANIQGQSYFSYIESVIPDNIIAPFLSANVLSVLIIAAAVGIAIAKLPADSKEQNLMITFFTALQSVLFTIVNWIIKILPIGIFGFFTVLAMQMATGVALGGLGVYLATVLTSNFVQMLVVLPLILLIRGINPLRVAKGMLPALTVAFFSKSSAGTLPVTMSCAENNLNVRPSVSRFVLPICTTINMNGCAAFILITVVYLMQNAGVDISLGTLLIWIVIATIAAVGNAGVPMGCFFLSASLLASMNVPILLMGVILPFYAVIDAIETTLNVWSDSNVAVLVNHDLYD